MKNRNNEMGGKQHPKHFVQSNRTQVLNTELVLGTLNRCDRGKDKKSRLNRETNLETDSLDIQNFIDTKLRISA